MQNSNATITLYVYFSITASIYIGNDDAAILRLNVETPHLAGDDFLIPK